MAESQQRISSPSFTEESYKKLASFEDPTNRDVGEDSVRLLKELFEKISETMPLHNQPDEDRISRVSESLTPAGAQRSRAVSDEFTRDEERKMKKEAKVEIVVLYLAPFVFEEKLARLASKWKKLLGDYEFVLKIVVAEPPFHTDELECLSLIHI